MKLHSEDETLKEYCRCVFELLKCDSVINELPEFCKQFIDEYNASFSNVKTELEASVYHSISCFIEDAFNDYIDENIRNANTAALGFDADVIFDMINLMKKYCDSREYFDFPEHVFKEFGLLIFQKFRGFKNTLLFSRSMSKSQEESLAKTLHRVRSDLYQLANKDIEDIKKETIKRIADSEKKAHEVNIGILGVFSAVVLVFNAAVSFYSTALNAFSNSSIYKILAILLIIGIIIIGAMMGLFYYLDRVRNGSTENISPISINPVIDKYYNGELFIDKKYVINKKKKVAKSTNQTSVLKSLTPFLITITILCALLFGVLFSWEKGYVEARNHNIGKLYQETSVFSDVSEEDDSIEESSQT